MNKFDLPTFAKHLIADAMFYDAEYGAIGSLSLVDEAAQKEMYIAYFLPEEIKFVIDKATVWEEYDAEEEGAIGYALAIDSNEHMSSKKQEDIAAEVLKLAEQQNLVPSLSLFFEEEGD